MVNLEDHTKLNNTIYFKTERVIIIKLHIKTRLG